MALAWEAVDGFALGLLVMFCFVFRKGGGVGGGSKGGGFS